MATSRVPELDEELRRRLGRRFGTAIDVWLDALPPVLADLSERWQIELGSLIRSGTVSVVIRCRTRAGHPAVLKVGPLPGRARDEAAALAGWKTAHVPAVLAVDDDAGALLIEAVRPGTPLSESTVYPRPEGLAELLTSLHVEPPPDRSYPSVADRIDHLFESGRKNYERRPDLAERIPPELYERGRRLAVRLAEDDLPTVLLHGDLTPVNILDGGEQRGWVAIDPAPCVGDPAFDAVDLVLWRADDLETIGSRVTQLAPALGSDVGRLSRWCTAFAAMTALETAEASDDLPERVDLMLALARAGS